MTKQEEDELILEGAIPNQIWALSYDRWLSKKEEVIIWKHLKSLNLGSAVPYVISKS